MLKSFFTALPGINTLGAAIKGFLGGLTVGFGAGQLSSSDKPNSFNIIAALVFNNGTCRLSLLGETLVTLDFGRLDLTAKPTESFKTHQIILYACYDYFINHTS